MTTSVQIINALLSHILKTEDDLSRAKRKLARDFGVGMLANNKLRAMYRQAVDDGLIAPSPELEKLLIKRPIRTLSGVAPITLATKPFPCPGRCVYCPTDVRMPKSYLASQPAAARALRLKFDPYKQVQSRLETLYANGHSPEKCDLRILGGTWSFYPKRYQSWFVREMYHGLNKFNPNSKLKTQNLKLRLKTHTLIAVQKQNETAEHRCIGMSIETRPDWITMEEIRRFRKFGVTKVELGVQHLDRGVMDLIKRDHYKEDVARATKLLKDAGFKVAYHIMPNLPGSTPEMDIAMCKELFEDESLRPDQLKIYPCVVLEKAALFEWYKRGEYKTYDDETLAGVIAEIKRHVPPYVRIERVYRDVPSDDIVDGSKHINIREFVQKRMRERGWECRCIRCREVRDLITNYKLLITNNLPREKSNARRAELQLYVDTYSASEGTEYFISCESPNRKILYAFTRLRLPSSDTKNQLTPLKNTAIIRELHTYGQLVPIQKRPGLLYGNRSLHTQHKGLGKQLLLKAEGIAKEEGYDTMSVISGVGVRGYYQKRGYELDEKWGYMVKKLT
ncbi:MAG: tRNA uridine(34) 5-carboxymethylaminomethyl modification radical SAM/GNAT enzyme Elp3 [Candidatus Jacksonbacteria bacterium]|nr:tRNA uridine(34) 5-carboxymethylaminomethyl modification radical SAM/GNAT enzyme Elp3 [Candidatus Jacksonbacteria bacterium]